MNIEDFIIENEILISEPIEEKPQNETEEDIKTVGQESILSIGNNPTVSEESIESIADNPTVSSNNYTEYLESIISRLEGVEDGIQDINDNLVSIGNGSGDSNNNQTGSVSQNILTTPINQYNLTDSLIVIELSIGLIVGIILLIRRLIYKWS